MFDGQEAEVRKQTRKLMRAILKFPLLEQEVFVEHSLLLEQILVQLYGQRSTWR